MAIIEKEDYIFDVDISKKQRLSKHIDKKS